MIKNTGISSDMLIKIFATYWDAPCKYKEGKDVWKRGSVRVNCLPLIPNGDCILLLKPLTEIKKEHMDEISKIMKGEVEFDVEISASEVREYAEHMLTATNEIPCAAADYLRREGFHVPVFSIDLFETGVAEPFKVPKKVNTRKYEQKQKNKKYSSAPPKA